MIKVDDIRKCYGEMKAVDGISFDISKGETFGLLGPNGAGKTTTIHMITGILKPDAGEIHINGEHDPTRADVRKNLGVAPQSLSLYSDLTGEENLAFFGKLYGLAGARLKERVEYALDFAGLKDRRKDQVKTYSGGMQRRLNLAVALIQDPQVLLLDEPTVGVDPQSRNLLFENIEALKKLGRTVVYTTHYMEEAQRLCDRVAIMDHGKILALDTVDALIEKHGGLSVVEIEFETVPTVQLPGKLEGATLRIETDKPLETVAKLSADGLKFVRMKIDRSDLETVFLNLTGRRLRD